ncbi:Flavocytochrome c cytochrome subunit [Thiorhodovibrio winogradskyi]|uniref:Flavocytochrome c cytochrome subunit n=1 Tax=Thiorhodovibrio winogradskyi TaxID=77007 RepID=A0ABZ0SDR3_9GAMM|nr:c-type cytochrome [Thiorhodovibrio winogradskyi]
MNKKNTTMPASVRQLLLLACALLPATAAAGPTGPTGQALAFTCAGCHGTDGSSVGPSMPAIAGMDPEVFVDAMRAYREDQRNPSIMNRIAKAYSDEQLEAMSWFFASQRLRVFPQEYDAALAARGVDLHQAYCEKCHENGGLPGDAGTLAGQWIPYLEFTMEDFLNGKRQWPRKMKRKVDAAIAEAGDQAIPALVNYYGSQSSTAATGATGATGVSADQEQ